MRRGAGRRLAWLPGVLFAASCARFGYELEGEADQVPGLRLDQSDASVVAQGGAAPASSSADAAGASSTGGAPSAGTSGGGGVSGAGASAGGAPSAGAGGSGFVLPACTSWGAFGAPELVTGIRAGQGSAQLM